MFFNKMYNIFNLVLFTFLLSLGFTLMELLCDAIKSYQVMLCIFILIIWSTKENFSNIVYLRSHSFIKCLLLQLPTNLMKAGHIGA